MTDIKRKRPPPPPPERRLSGGGGGTIYSHPQTSRNAMPDWDFWRSMRAVKEWQACALSLNIDPDSLKPDPQRWMAGPGAGLFFTSRSFPSNDVEDRFEKRRRILRSNRWDRAIFTVPMQPGSCLAQDELILSEFAAWGISIGWNDMPRELVAIATPVGLAPPVNQQPAQPSAAEATASLASEVSVSTRSESELTPSARRAQLDITRERGARRRILEKWDDIEKEYGKNIDARHVHRVLKRDKGEDDVALKTIQNHLSVLRREGLIP
jgi:hypothetical protein